MRVWIVQFHLPDAKAACSRSTSTSTNPDIELQQLRAKNDYPVEPVTNMHCSTCGDEIDTRGDTRYETITPIPGGGQTSDSYCSVQCLNEDVGYSDEEIESLMRQAGYEVPPEFDFDWAVRLQSNIDSPLMHSRDGEGEFHILLEHTERDYDIEIFHDSQEKLFEIALYTYEIVEGEKMGLTDVETNHTGLFQRALAYAESFMKKVEGGSV